MRTVTVTKKDFLTRVRNNRDHHRVVFETALDGYQQRLMRELERRVRDLKHGQAIDQYIGLSEPEDHTEDYDRILTMAEMSISDTIELSENEFAMYVMDQWDWKRSFAQSPTAICGEASGHLGCANWLGQSRPAAHVADPVMTMPRPQRPCACERVGKPK